MNIAQTSTTSSTHPPEEKENQYYSKLKIFLSPCKEV